MAVSTWTEPVAAPTSKPPLLEQRILVRTLRLEARIGIHPHEQDHSQVLIIDVEIETQPRRVTELSETLNYEAVVQGAQACCAAARRRGRRGRDPGWTCHTLARPGRGLRLRSRFGHGRADPFKGLSRGAAQSGQSVFRERIHRGGQRRPGASTIAPVAPRDL